MTEDVVRFATVAVLADHGVAAARLAAERTVQDIGRVDLFVDPPSGSAVEFKFPREPAEMNAADTMEQHGEMSAAHTSSSSKTSRRPGAGNGSTTERA